MKELFNASEAKYLKSYFIKKDLELGVDRIKSQRSQKNFQDKLLAVSKPKRPELLNWKTFAASVVSSLALGALIAKFTLQPVVIYGGARSVDLVSGSTDASSVSIDSKKSEQANSSLTIQGDQLRLPGSAPAWLQVVQLASSAADEVVIERLDKGLRLRIFLPKEAGDGALALRLALGLRPEVSGWITVNFSGR